MSAKIRASIATVLLAHLAAIPCTRADNAGHAHSHPGSVSIVVTYSANKTLCRGLIAPIGEVSQEMVDIGEPYNRLTPYDEVITASRMGSSIKLGQWSVIPPDFFPDSGDPVASASTVQYDFWDSGTPITVYKFSTGGSYSDDFLVVPQAGVTQDDVIKMAQAAGVWENVAPTAREKGWRVFGPENSAHAKSIDALVDGVQINLVRLQGSTYLLLHPERGSGPLAILVKPKPDGRVEDVCVFRQGVQGF